MTPLDTWAAFDRTVRRARAQHGLTKELDVLAERISFGFESFVLNKLLKGEPPQIEPAVMLEDIADFERRWKALALPGSFA